jgi:hypothetical protein
MNKPNDVTGCFDASNCSTASPVVMKFIDAPLGCRFKYLGAAYAAIWIKLSDERFGLIAEYHPEFIRTPKWVCQKIYSFAESKEELQTLRIEVIG